MVARRVGRARRRSQAAAVVLAFLTGDALGHVIEASDRTRLVELVIAVLIVGALRAAFMAGRRLISGRQALGVEFDMRNALYNKLTRLSFGFYDRHQTGQLMSSATVDLQSAAVLPRLRAHFLLPAHPDRRRRHGRDVLPQLEARARGGRDHSCARGARLPV